MAGLAHKARVGLVVIALGIVAFGASACSNSAAIGDGRSACKWVATSVATLQNISTTATPAQRQAQTLLAQSQLLRALPYAANATSADGSYNALMTNIQEADRVPESYLVPALVAMCKVINSPTPYLGS